MYQILIETKKTILNQIIVRCILQLGVFTFILGGP